MPKRTKLLTGHDRLEQLLRRAQRGDNAAVNAIIAENMGFFVLKTRQYAKTFKLPEHLWEDAIQEACLLVQHKAVPKWRKDKGKFTTYANWWILAAVQSFSRQHGTTTKLSRRAMEQNAAIRNRRQKHVAEHGEELDRIKAAAELGIPEKRVRALNSGLQVPVRLDAASADGETREAYDAMQQQHQIANAALGDNVALHAKVREAMDALLPVERRVLLLYYWRGIDYHIIGNELRPGQIGGRKAKNVVRQRVKQIEQRALRKLRKALGVANDTDADADDATNEDSADATGTDD